MTSVSLSRAGRPLLGFAVFALALVAWEGWARSEDSFVVPPASAVLSTAWEVWPTSEFLSDVAASLRRLAAGFALGASIGVCIGVLMGSSRTARRALEPLVELARATPVIAVVPAAIVVLGFGDAMQIGVIAFAVCFPVLVNTLDGVRSIPPEIHDTASMLHVGKFGRMRRIDLPGALPSIAAGLRVAVSLGLIAVVISEFVGETDGLGSRIWLEYTQSDVEALYAGLVFLGVLGFVLNRIFLVLERRFLSWHEGFAGDQAR
jgi:ABC-type nitrate/sulfonate/bicarbonate transport system permease component